MTEKLVCGGLIEKGGYSLIEVLGFKRVSGEPCGILGLFGAAGISLTYLSAGNGADGLTNMSFCVQTEELAVHRELLAEIRVRFLPQKVMANGPMVILTLYGPHFMERPTLASQVFTALCADSIDPHTVCSSVSSISVVVDTHDRDVAVACLRAQFQWPD